MPGFMIRYDAIKKINFSSLGCGDFHFMEKIAKQSKNPLWVNKVIGSTSPVRRQGKGERKDAVSYEEAREASGIKYL